MAEYKTPGVYIEEISTLPPSVVRVATAVPAFVGYTESTPDGYEVSNPKPIRITSMLEYEQMFGGEPTDPADRSITVVLDDANGYAVDSVELSTDYYLYQSLRFFYNNGGGVAYIVSVGDYDDDIDKDELIDGVNALEQADEPTLILTPDAFGLADVGPITRFTLLGEVQAAVLAHCNKMQDRFGIFDIIHDENVSLNVALTDAAEFRTRIGNQFLKYGAAYYPELNTTITPNGDIDLTSFSMQKKSDDSAVSLTLLGTETGDSALVGYNTANVDVATLPNEAALDAFETDYGAVAASGDKAELVNLATEIKDLIDAIYALGNTDVPPLTNSELIAYVNERIGESASELRTAAETLMEYDSGFALIDGPETALGVITASDYDGSGYTDAPNYALAVAGGLPAFYTAADVPQSVTDARAPFQALFDSVHALYTEIVDKAAELTDDSELFTISKPLASIVQNIRGTGYTLPPSGGIAGVYASVDNNVGVWKAPANVSMNSVSSVARKFTQDETDNLNRPDNGKAVNAIRFFRGRGILVYGARTLAGNDNEWRYVPVRRLFNMVEESVKKATEPFVFEPNDANTWQKVKAMIENFLLTLWRDGALAGAKPEDAFFVKVGLGETMTSDDILNGYMNVEIGMAAVRPAEFIILKFSHKLQES
jgi:hypothetical protein